ncbi:MAG: hypothetical protein K6E72_00680 [Saccharofermentans sp.]|nr:hypothetical protein [Saccharofermentans sp.]
MKSSINNRFKQECKIIKLANEYRGYKGEIPYAVITDLTEEELNSKYEEELSEYRPFLILTRAMGLAIIEHQRNNQKYYKRSKMKEVSYEVVFNLLTVDDIQTIRDSESAKDKQTELILEAGRNAMKLLTPLQRRYISRYYIDGANLRDIAMETGTRIDTVWENIESARRKFRKAFNDLEVA